MSRRDASLTPELLAQIRDDWLKRALGYKADNPRPKIIKLVEPAVKDEPEVEQPPPPPAIKQDEPDEPISPSESEEEESD